MILSDDLPQRQTSHREQKMRLFRESQQCENSSDR